MSCQHGNHPDACDICDEVDAAYASGVASCKQALRDQEAEIARLRGLLHAESVLLRAWARESREGGWSTHQVDPMNRRADEITAHLGAKHE